MPKQKCSQIPSGWCGGSSVSQNEVAVAVRLSPKTKSQFKLCYSHGVRDRVRARVRVKLTCFSRGERTQPRVFLSYLMIAIPGKTFSSTLHTQLPHARLHFCNSTCSMCKSIRPRGCERYLTEDAFFSYFPDFSHPCKYQCCDGFPCLLLGFLW